LWNIVEGEDAPAELEKEICAKRNEAPKRNLEDLVSVLLPTAVLVVSGSLGTNHRYNLILNLWTEGNESEEADEV
jgi:hypothetical protein